MPWETYEIKVIIIIVVFTFIFIVIICQDEEPIKPLDEKQKAALTSAYKLPQTPCILVHPNAKAKSGKFDCSVMSLSLLLDYRQDDNKEGTFEGKVMELMLRNL